MSDTAKLTFKVRVRTVKYGDRRKFSEYKILMCRGGTIAGVEDGPRRETKDRNSALKAARARIAVLKTHRLYAVAVTNKHISDGEARSCHACAIAQALFHNQDRMGFAKREFNFEVSPYGMFINPRGIVLSTRFGEDLIALPAEKLPAMVVSRGPDPYPESMIDWAVQFDDWAESRNETLKQWRERTGWHDDRPYRPGPASFVIDLDAFEPATQR